MLTSTGFKLRLSQQRRARLPTVCTHLLRNYASKIDPKLEFSKKWQNVSKAVYSEQRCVVRNHSLAILIVSTFVDCKEETK